MWHVPSVKRHRPSAGTPALFGGAGSGAGRSFASSVRASPAVRAAIDRRVRLWMAKDEEGQRTDREYFERSIRRPWSLTDPNQFAEPTSRMNLSSWIIPRPDAATFPSVHPDPRRVTRFSVPPTTTPPSDTDAIDEIAKCQHSSFMATRHGLCKIRRRKVVYSAEPQDRFFDDVYVAGCSSRYPAHFAQQTGVLHLYRGTQARPTDAVPWQFFGSGCLPIFYMDQPMPHIKAMPSIPRDVDRFGDTVRAKFRELRITIEELPFTHTYAPGGAREWPPPLPASDPESKRAGLVNMQDRPEDKVRIIIFTRKKTHRDVAPTEGAVYPPLFPPAPAGAYLPAGEGRVDQTTDTPMFGEKVYTYPSDHPDSPFVIVEDVVMEYPKFRMTGQGRGQSTATGGNYASSAAYDTDVLFQNYGAEAANTIIPTADRGWDQRATMSLADADGLPHNMRKIEFVRKYKDDGHKLSWSLNGKQNDVEMAPAERKVVRPVICGNTGVIVASSPATLDAETQIDMCEKELFVTVLTGAYLECHAFRAPVDEGGTPLTLFQVEDETPVAGQHTFGWRLSPYNVCAPAMVEISTKMWYSEEGPEGAPSQLRVVDDTGATIGRVVQDRAQYQLPGDVDEEL